MTTKNLPEGIRKLDTRQTKFVNLYLGGGDQKCAFNAYRSMIGAGYAKSTADHCVGQVLNNKSIQYEIERRCAKLVSKANINILQVLRGLNKIAYSDLRDLFNDDGTLVAPKDLDDDIVMAVSEITVTEKVNKAGELFTTYKYKLMDKKSALETLGKYYQMFAPDIHIDGDKFISELAKINRNVEEDIKKIEKKMEVSDADFEVIK